MSYRNYYGQIDVIRDLVSGAIKYFNTKTFDKEKTENKFQVALDDFELIIDEIETMHNYGTSIFEWCWRQKNNFINILRKQLIDISEDKLTVARALLDSRELSLPGSYMSSLYLYRHIVSNNNFDKTDLGYDKYISGIRSVLGEIITKDVPINLLFPQYDKLSGVFLEEIYPELTKIVTPENLNIYAMVKNSDVINYQERANFSGVAIGEESYHLVTNNAFDIIMAHPNYEFETISENNDMSPEIKRLKKYWNYLKDDGILILNTPSIALSRNICLYLKNHFILQGARIWSVGKEQTNSPLVIYILVLKKMPRVFTQNAADSSISDLQFQILRDLSLQRGSFDFQKPLPKLQPESKFAPIKIFRGEKPDISVLMSILSKSPIYCQTKETKKFQCQPPLPFEKGQIGLVLASGRLDGVIDEGNGYKHLIRGRVYKGISTNNEIIEEHDGNMNGAIKTTRTITNLTEINVITGSGQYKRIIVPVEIN